MIRNNDGKSLADNEQYSFAGNGAEVRRIVVLLQQRKQRLER